MTIVFQFYWLRKLFMQLWPETYSVWFRLPIRFSRFANEFNWCVKTWTLYNIKALANSTSDFVLITCVQSLFSAQFSLLSFEEFQYKKKLTKNTKSSLVWLFTAHSSLFIFFSRLKLTDRLIDLVKSWNYTVSILNWLQVIKMLQSKQNCRLIYSWQLN